MATLQKPKPRINRPSSPQQITEDATNAEQANGDTNELEQLMLEPVSYDHLCTTTIQQPTERLKPELVQSLQSVKQVCLVSLDSLLRQLVHTIPSKSQRRLSDSSLHETTLLGSIVQSTRRLSTAQTMKKSDSTPATLTLVHQVLTQQQQHASLDYNMCCALAALLHHVYRILELDYHSSDDDNEPCTSSLVTDDDIYSQLVERLTTFQHKDKLMTNSNNKEMTILWDELDQLMNSITCLATQPPAYHDIVPPPPGYHDLDQLLDAIDQLSHVSPRLNNQRVALTERQAKELAAATVGRTVERLSKGQEEVDMLQGLMNQIQRSSLRSLDNQRVCMTTNRINNNKKKKAISQAWATPEQQMIDDMTTMTDMLSKVMNRPKYNQQRYSLSAMKEREFFFHKVLHKMDRMEDRRMTNQDAEWITPRPKQLSMEDELGSLFDTIHRSKSQLDNQRATFTSTPLLLS
ncbi:hypothetical protein BC941DRAFT_432463 [Chlamydoabsidia padenii]|nr:hypothetical protein BC941DRAFT_432463 [Chlamydoabsidia padenii]